MRRGRVIFVVAIAVLALAAMSASGASAKASERLLLATGEGVVPMGGTVVAEQSYSLGDCAQRQYGPLIANGYPKDEAALGQALGNECESRYSISGGIQTIQLDVGGTAMYKGKVTITGPGPCVYELSKLDGAFQLFSAVRVAGQGTAKLVKQISIGSCKKTQATSFESEISDGENGDTIFSAIPAQVA
jgi:hypothetical protein